MMYTCKGALLFAITLAMTVSLASADLLYDHFGVTLELGPAQTDSLNGGTYTPFASGTFEPTLHTDTVDYVTNDWFGSWSFTSADQALGGLGSGDIPAGAEPYDIEAMYFDDTSSDLLIVIVTSFDAPPGRIEDRVIGDPFIVPGDLAINLGLNSPYGGDGFSYDYGVNISHENRQAPGEGATSGGTTVGDELYRTSNADWYVGSPVGAPPSGAELTNFDPNWGSFGGSYLGETSTAYYEYDFGGGAQECRYPTYIIEVTIPRALLPDMSPGDTVDIGWAEGCRNDGHVFVKSLRFEDPPDIDTPEPGTLVLMGLGSLGMGWWKRRRKLAE